MATFTIATLRLFVGLALATAALCHSAHAQDDAALAWLCVEVTDGVADGWLRWEIDPSVSDADSANLTIVTDGHCSLYVNGQRILKHASLKNSDGVVTAAGYELKSLLRQGRNSLAVEIHSDRNDAVLGLSLLKTSGNDSSTVGGRWKIAPAAPPVGWQQTDFNDRDWKEVAPMAEGPGTRFTVKMPSDFVAPVIAAKARTTPFQFEDGDRVVFVGATFLERAQLSEHLEATLTGTLGEKQVTFRNLGWSADTVFADSRGIFEKPDVGYLRMVEHIRAEEPTVAVICYGQNEALTPGMTPELYSQQIVRLLDELAASGIACVLLSPHELLPARRPIPSPSRFNAAIKVYAEATASVAQSRGLPYVDVFTDFTKQMLAIDYALNSCYKMEPGSETDPDSADAVTSSVYGSLSANGMHLTDHGYACASVIVRDRLLSIPAKLPVVTVDTEKKTVDSDSASIRNMKWNASDTEYVTFDVKENFVSALPLVISVSGATAAEGPMQSGTIQSGEETMALQQRVFVDLNNDESSQSRSFVAPAGPQYEAMRSLILKKNELYFHRWRPQNITYLFGFRKHEQGNNAADIAKFDPFIQELEKQIHDLQQPQWRTVTLRVDK